MASANGDELVDITDLVRRCASQCLSHSNPFTPQAKDAAASFGGRGHDDGECDAVTDGTLLDGLQIQSNAIGKHGAGGGMAPLDLLDAMTALELGDKRMDCCEIPVIDQEPSSSAGDVDDENDSSTDPKQPVDPSSLVTYPPRIAPTSLTDGTPGADHASNHTALSSVNFPANTLLLPSSPCPSLLPHWDSIAISSTSLVPLLMLQLTALEAYVGTNNGGSNAAETLYCMMWFHDGVLMDMSERLGVNIVDPGGDVSAGVEKIEMMNGEYCKVVPDGTKVSDANNDRKDLVADELTVARWILFASSLGVVRIAEAIRWCVVNADFWEEEDFGVSLHGDKATPDDQGAEKLEEGEPLDENTPNGTASGDGDSPPIDKGDQAVKKDWTTTMRFCPALQGSQYIEVVWDTALSYLRLYRTTCMANEMDMDQLNPVIDALEAILTLQQSFFQAIKILSHLNDETVCDFAKLAVKRSRETVDLIEKLRGNAVVAEISKDGLVGVDGRLLPKAAKQPETNHLLSASFDPFVNRRLLGNAPVRKACFRCPLDVLTSLSQISAELEWGVCDPLLYGNTFGRITRMLERNSLRGCGGAVPMPAPKKKESSRDKGETELDKPFGMNILARSLIVLNLYFDDKLFGQYDFSQMIGQHMKQQCGVPELLIESTCADGGLPWLTRLAKPMYDTLKALCLNRHRERGFTESIVLPAFQLLQYEAATVDEKFKEEHGLDPKTTPSYATNYVILNTIRLMERHVGLGIELGLYPNWYDLSTAIWYRDFLLSALINVRGSIEQERVRRIEMDSCIRMEEEAKAHNQQQGKKKGKAKKGHKPKQPKEPKEPAATTPNASSSTSETRATSPAEDFEDRLDYTSLLLRRNLCRGLVRYIAALRQAEILPDPPASTTMFTTHQKRFEKRFEAFGALPQPPHLSYEDYTRGSDFSAVQSKDLVASASECFRSGKGVVDWLLEVIVPESSDDSAVYGPGPEKRKDDDWYISIRREEIMGLAKVCVTNSLFLHKLALATSGKKGGSHTVSLEFKAHKQYCTLSIT